MGLLNNITQMIRVYKDKRAEKAAAENVKFTVNELKIQQDALEEVLSAYKGLSAFGGSNEELETLVNRAANIQKTIGQEKRRLAEYEVIQEAAKLNLQHEYAQAMRTRNDAWLKDYVAETVEAAG